MRDRSVRSGDVRLAVREYGDPDRPTLIALHGFPDNQRMWEPFAGHVGDRLHLVTYDARGAGESSSPPHTGDYSMSKLTDDLVAVMDAVSPDRPVHVFGHDWGGIQLWEPVMRRHDDERLQGRLASYSVVSAPCLDYLATSARHGSPMRAVRQLRHSWYIPAFHLPWLPELVWRRAHNPIGRRLAAASGVPQTGAWDDRLASDGANGVQLYRANMLAKLRHPRPARVDLPVQLIVALQDGFVTPRMMDAALAWCDDVHRVEIDSDHWVPRTHPEELAELIVAWVQSHDG